MVAMAQLLTKCHFCVQTPPPTILEGDMDNYNKTLDTIYPKLARGRRCYLCGRPATEIHHIRRREIELLRYDLNNLLPLCRDCHSEIHARKLNLDLYISMFRMDYLNKMSRIQFQDYLLSHDMTREDFFKLKLKELKEAINGKH